MIDRSEWRSGWSPTQPKSSRRDPSDNEAIDTNDDRRLGRFQKKIQGFLKPSRIAAIVLAIAVVAFNLWIAIGFANDLPGDGKIYDQIAINVLEQGVFSAEAQPPFTPTLIRLPGYPLFLAGVYSIFGHGNETAVRVIQALINTVTAFLAGLLAWNWFGGSRRRRRVAALWALVL
jgi:hypothetical protein